AIRRDMRLLINRLGRITATGDSEDATYAMYADFSEQVSKIASHRVLAINRGTKEGKLKSGLEVPEDAALELICRHVVT
ncbi:MAG: RNA-binding transcriptional accessory protein, partial [Angelakisella sp.]